MCDGFRYFGDSEMEYRKTGWCIFSCDGSGDDADSVYYRTDGAQS